MPRIELSGTARIKGLIVFFALPFFGLIVLSYPLAAKAADAYTCVRKAEPTKILVCEDATADVNPCQGLGCSTGTPTAECEVIKNSGMACSDLTGTGARAAQTCEEIAPGKTACSKKCAKGYEEKPEGACKKGLKCCAKIELGEAEVKKAAAIPQLRNPLGTTDVRILLGRVVRAFLGISGSLALVMFVYGGFVWITSGGSPERIHKGKLTMVWAVIGIAFIFSSYAILNYLFRTLSA